MSLDDLAYAAGNKTTNVFLSPVSLIQAVWGGVATGTANAIAVSTAVAPAALTAGMFVIFKASANNSGATTLSVNGLTATAVQIKGSALSGGEIDQHGLYLACYTGTVFDLLQVS